MCHSIIWTIESPEELHPSTVFILLINTLNNTAVLLVWWYLPYRQQIKLQVLLVMSKVKMDIENERKRLSLDQL